MYMNMYYPDWLLVLVKLSNYKLSTKGCVIEIGDLVFHKDDLALGVPHSSEQGKGGTHRYRSFSQGS